MAKRKKFVTIETRDQGEEGHHGYFANIEDGTTPNQHPLELNQMHPIRILVALAALAASTVHARPVDLAAFPVNPGNVPPKAEAVPIDSPVFTGPFGDAAIAHKDKHAVPALDRRQQQQKKGGSPGRNMSAATTWMMPPVPSASLGDALLAHKDKHAVPALDRRQQ
ncbi:hypothetical protein HDU96_004202 [Phlyctochytrium bullatum]|nr:hypothetical protein HDU96_004202 [Phlyctochytrium bullatum]